MNTRHARLILTILREGSFTAAAKALHITQPTLSKTVSQIESNLGETIFLRGHSSVALTPAGELYVQAARRIIHAETQLEEGISMLRGSIQGTLRVGIMLHRSGELIPQVLTDFLTAYPGVTLDVREDTAAGLETLLLNHEIDMALMSCENQNTRLEYRQIASEKIVLLAGKQTALAKRIPSGSTIGLREAENEQFLLPPHTSVSRRYFDDLLSSCAVRPHACLFCDNVEAAKRACASAGLVMLAPFITLLCDSGSMQKLNHYHLGTDTYLPPLYMVSSRENPLAPHAEMLYTLMSNRYRAMNAYRVL